MPSGWYVIHPILAKRMKLYCENCNKSLEANERVYKIIANRGKRKFYCEKCGKLREEGINQMEGNFGVGRTKHFAPDYRRE